MTRNPLTASRRDGRIITSAVIVAEDAALAWRPAWWRRLTLPEALRYHLPLLPTVTGRMGQGRPRAANVHPLFLQFGDDQLRRDGAYPPWKQFGCGRYGGKLH